MARNSTLIDAPPEAVWKTLTDPYAYPQWVVGADRTLAADEHWPAPGSRFRVRLGGGAEDHTTVRELDPGRRIVLHAGSSKFGPARVTIELEPAGDGTKVTMVEDPVGKIAPLRLLPPVQLMLRVRNAEAVDRLRGLVERRHARDIAITP